MVLLMHSSTYALDQVGAPSTGKMLHLQEHGRSWTNKVLSFFVDQIVEGQLPARRSSFAASDEKGDEDTSTTDANKDQTGAADANKDQSADQITNKVEQLFEPGLPYRDLLIRHGGPSRVWADRAQDALDEQLEKITEALPAIGDGIFRGKRQTEAAKHAREAIAGLQQSGPFPEVEQRCRELQKTANKLRRLVRKEAEKQHIEET
ncbi:unnamed protein product [Amoebophrya sp. A25]|nr:unnamed protein product [Amoebophrya sp. A25]|eukprot:GSA25T00019090001.1